MQQSAFIRYFRTVPILLIFFLICNACKGTHGHGVTNTPASVSSAPALPPGVEIIALQVEPATVILKAGESDQFTLTAIGTDGNEYTNPEAIWAVDDIKVATLHSDRIVFAVAAGTAFVTAQWQGVTSNTATVIVPGDPMFSQQWHLKNIGQNGGYPGEDVDVEPVWRTGVKGESVVIALVDDGLEVNHADLVENVAREFCWNYLDYNDDPSTGAHGTSVAGLMAARDSNGIGGLGIAPRARLAGFNLLENYSTANEADAMLRHADQVSVSNNSWGAEDGTGELFRSYSTWRNAVEQGTQQGRQGKGIVYVWAAGNGGRNEIDNSNYDGQANNRHVMAVAAVGDDGTRASYSEQGANLWLSAPSRGDSGQGLTTTDRTGELGFNSSVTQWDGVEKDFTKYFSGTSAAAPLVTGVVALVLDVNPQLTWRDVRIILARTARMNDATHPDWQFTHGGFRYHINHSYGFGVPNAQAAVSLAREWEPLGPELVYETPIQWVRKLIPDNDAQGIVNEVYVPEDFAVEFVEVVFDASNHENQGDLSIILTAPSGTQSVLAQTHYCRNDPCESRYINWVFGSARHLEESSLGVWRLQVSDRRVGTEGKFRSWVLRVYGHKNA